MAWGGGGESVETFDSTQMKQKENPNNDCDGNVDNERQRNRSMEHPTSNSNFIRFKRKLHRRTIWNLCTRLWIISNFFCCGQRVYSYFGIWYFAWMTGDDQRENCFAMGKVCTVQEHLASAFECVRYYSSEYIPWNMDVHGGRRSGAATLYETFSTLRSETHMRYAWHTSAYSERYSVGGKNAKCFIW